MSENLVIRRRTASTHQKLRVNETASRQKDKRYQPSTAVSPVARERPEPGSFPNHSNKDTRRGFRIDGGTEQVRETEEGYKEGRQGALSVLTCRQGAGAKVRAAAAVGVLGEFCRGTETRYINAQVGR